MGGCWDGDCVRAVTKLVRGSVWVWSRSGWWLGGGIA
nr:MAG TPA: hypothetical protein [Caudoviricetes sp.]